MSVPVLLFAAVVLNGCTTIRAGKVPADQALMAGYSTHCRGSVMILDREANLSSSQYRPAGPQILTLAATGELEDPEQYDSGNGYFCRDRSLHTLTFNAQGGKVYRLHLESKKKRQYAISVWEGTDERGIETRPIESQSIQTDIKRECRFFSCDPFLKN